VSREPRGGGRVPQPVGLVAPGGVPARRVAVLDPGQGLEDRPDVGGAQRGVAERDAGGEVEVGGVEEVRGHAVLRDRLPSGVRRRSRNRGPGAIPLLHGIGPAWTGDGGGSARIEQCGGIVGGAPIVVARAFAPLSRQVRVVEHLELT
jgi:hypothetical protein